MIVNPDLNETEARTQEEKAALVGQAQGELDSAEQKQKLAQRDDFASFSFGLAQAWVGFMMVVTMAQMGLRPLGYGLETAEFITVFTTSTVAVLGYGMLVGRYLFPSGKQ